MRLFSISTYPEKVLRKRCQPVMGVKEAENEIFDKMLYAMKHYKGIGLAAPQVGLSKQLIVVDTGAGIIKLANPVVIEKSGSDEMEEGCLSIPGKMVHVKRDQKVVVSGLNHKGEQIEIQAEGLLARVLQHEIDHLNGRLIIDYLNWWERIKLFIGVRIVR